MYKYTEYPSIRPVKPGENVSAEYLQEKIDGANVRVIVPRNGGCIILGTRKVILSDGVSDFKNFKREFECELRTLAIENLRPRVDELGVEYEEFVIHGELVGRTVFDRLKYKIDGLKVFFYDLSVFRKGERVTIPWRFREIQTSLKESGFRTIPYSPFSPELLARIDDERSFLNPDEHIEGFVLRDESGQKVYKRKSAHYKSVEFGGKKSKPLKANKHMYEHVRNKFGDIATLPPEESLCLLVDEMVSNYSTLKRKEPSRKWIKDSRDKCVRKFFPGENIDRDVFRSVIGVS